MSRRLLIPAVVLVAGVAGWLIFTQVGKAPDPARSVPPAATPEAPASTWREPGITVDQLSDPAASPHDKIRRVYVLVQNYTQAVRRRGGPPLSTNQEFTRALTGANPLRVQFLPPGHASISPGGELLDPWSTPYFFHVLSADSVEIQSAGPDRIPFNSDDLVFPPPRPGNSLESLIRPRSAPQPPTNRPGQPQQGQPSQGQPSQGPQPGRQQGR